MKRIILAALVGVLVSVASAKATTGNKLYEECKVKEATCKGYVAAVWDILRFGKPVHGHKACIPENVDINQLVDIFANWLEKNVGERHYVATQLVARAISETFPCKKQ